MADDELNRSEVKSDDQTEDQNLPAVSGLEDYRAKVAQLEGLVTRKGKELRLAHARVTELEQAVADRDSTIANLEQSVTESDERLAAANNSLVEAVASYREMAVSANPVVPAELVTGDTIEAINESLEKSKALVSKVKQGLEAEITQARVPAGAPLRTPPDLSALSPREKIQYAIGGKS